jgi:hypothetical protein
MIYGHDKTIYNTEQVNVEVDKHGEVVSVWFRCMPIPFDQTVVREERASEMRRMYAGLKTKIHRLVAVEVIDQ